jgi:hypothetical protein
VSRLSRRCGILNISRSYRPAWPVTGIALFFISIFMQLSPSWEAASYSLTRKCPWTVTKVLPRSLFPSGFPTNGPCAYRMPCTFLFPWRDGLIQNAVNRALYHEIFTSLLICHPALVNICENSETYCVSGVCSSPGILNTRKINFSETGSHWLRLALSKGPYRVGSSLPSPEDRRKDIQFQKHCVFWYLECQAMAVCENIY